MSGAHDFEWELVSPEGPAQAIAIGPAARPATLAGKTIGLSWNGKPGGRQALEEMAQLIRDREPSVSFIRFWEEVPESWAVQLRELDDGTIRKMASLKPDLVITAQGD
jgi:hypothetical protein